MAKSLPSARSRRSRAWGGSGSRIRVKREAGTAAGPPGGVTKRSDSRNGAPDVSLWTFTPLLEGAVPTMMPACERRRGVATPEHRLIVGLRRSEAAAMFPRQWGCCRCENAAMTEGLREDEGCVLSVSRSGPQVHRQLRSNPPLVMDEARVSSAGWSSARVPGPAKACT